MASRLPARVWLPADTALWTTCHIVSDVVKKRPIESHIQTLFPLSPGVTALTMGGLLVDAFYAAGDGSYAQSRSFAFGRGLFGLALAAGTLAARATGNSNARNRAAANAQIAWRPLFGGTIFVTTHGFYLQTMKGLFEWTWDSIDLMQLVGYNCLILQGRSSTGPITWRLNSEWAELVFALWALARHPSHPQLQDGSWLPANWLEWATHQGYRSHLDRPQISG